MSRWGEENFEQFKTAVLAVGTGVRSLRVFSMQTEV